MDITTVDIVKSFAFVSVDSDEKHPKIRLSNAIELYI